MNKLTKWKKGKVCKSTSGREKTILRESKPSQTFLSLECFFPFGVQPRKPSSPEKKRKIMF